MNELLELIREKDALIRKLQDHIIALEDRAVHKILDEIAGEDLSFVCWTDGNLHEVCVKARTSELAAEKFFEEHMLDDGTEEWSIVNVQTFANIVLRYGMVVGRVVKAKLMRRMEEEIEVPVPNPAAQAYLKSSLDIRELHRRHALREMDTKLFGIPVIATPECPNDMWFMVSGEVEVLDPKEKMMEDDAQILREKPPAMRMPMPFGYEGEYDRLIEDGQGGGIAEWQPGDGTRYLMVVKALSPRETKYLGSYPGGVIVSVGPGTDNWTSLVLFPGDVCHVAYFAEKVRNKSYNDYTIKILTAFVNLVIGNTEYGATLARDTLAERG